MGQHQSSPENILMTLQNLNLGELTSLESLLKLKTLVNGHEHDVISFLSDVVASSKSQSVPEMIEKVQQSESWPQIQELLPQIIQWASGGEVKAQNIQKMDSNTMLQKFILFMKHAKNANAQMQLVNSFKKNLITPPM